ncbi:MAG: amidase [Candidatus Nitrosocosmicus sp.]
MAKKGNIPTSLFSINQIATKIENGDISPADLVDICLQKIKKLNPILNSFITVIDEQQIYQQAEISGKKIKQGNYFGPLHGIPFSIKDNINAKNVRSTAGSKIFSDHISQTEATIVKKMIDAGAILIGTNNMDEFASGITGKNSFYGDSKNPWNPKRISGGSSGGAAAAVASGMVLASLGTDTGGSIRVPCSLCGTVGLKPTYNLISKKNVCPLSPSLDHVGCITKNVKDVSIILNAICKKRFKKNNGKIISQSISHTCKRNRKNKEIVLGIPQNYFLDFLDSEVEFVFYNFIRNLSSSKIKIEDIKLHNTENYFKSWKNVRLAEASQIHQRWINSRELDYSKEVRNMLVKGSRVLAIDYIYANHIVKQIRKEYVSLMEYKIDALITPTTIITAPYLDEGSVMIKDCSMNIREALLRNTIIFNSLGLPAISIPVGFTSKNGLPVGLQIIGPPFGDQMILNIANYFEQINNKIQKFP